MGIELTNVMADLTTDLWEKTEKVKTTASIEGKNASFLERNAIDRKNQAVGDKMDEVNHDAKIANIVDKRVKANLAKKKGKGKEKAMQKIFGQHRNPDANARKEWSEWQSRERNEHRSLSKYLCAKLREQFCGEEMRKNPTGENPQETLCLLRTPQRNGLHTTKTMMRIYYHRGRDRSRSCPRYKYHDESNNEEY